MSHAAQQVYFQTVKKAFPELFKDTKVLEVGSLDLNGSVRHLFEDCDYTGVDLEEGPGVDLAAQGQDLDFPDKTFDVTISAECFEHNPFWRETFSNMKRMTKAGGIVTFSCAGIGRGEHGTHDNDPESSPFTIKVWNYYMNLAPYHFSDEDLYGLDYRFTTNDWFHDLYFTGVKIPVGGNGKPIVYPMMRELDRINWYDI